MRYLVVGYGNIGHKRQVVLGKKCFATVDIDPTKKTDFLDSALVPEKLLPKFQAVIICTSQQPKLDLVKYWLNKGKHVLVEKPLIIDQQQAKELQLLARKNHVIWYSGYNHRFEPNIVKIKQILDKNTIGPLYHARFVYSFGNIQERIDTWRETKFGVLEEIAPHVIDFAHLFWGYEGKDLEPLITRRVEAKIYDHWVFCTKDKKVVFETSSVTWKNVFSIDIYGEKGSVHMSNLCKWGGSELIVRTRVLPSGVPLKKKTFTPSPDQSWKKDFINFERMVKENQTSLKNDIQISLALNNITQGAK